MPRPKKPPRLEIRSEGGKRVWVIRDGQRYKRTGCAEDNASGAHQALARYLTERFAPDTSIRHASKAEIATILGIYWRTHKDSVARPAELRSRLQRLEAFWGDKFASDVKGDACRQYVKERGARIAARRELETMRAAVNYYAREYGLDVTPKFTLPEDSQSRERWLTRSEAAKLLWAAYRSPFHKHLVRFILIGLYTGTRHKAILSLQWMPNTTGGWVDLEKGVLYRRGTGQRETKKRRPPSRIPPRLLAHLRRWEMVGRGSRYIVQYDGRPIQRIEKAFRAVRKRAGLSDDVTPHCMRHSRCTWLLERGVPIWEVAGSLGMTVQMVESVYGHHAADFQRKAAEAY